MRIADDFYLTAHDTAKGRCRLTSAPLGVGLASGLFAELILSYRITLRGPHLTVLDDSPTDDLATAALLAQLSAGHRSEVRGWLAYLSSGLVADLVARRLLRDDKVRRAPRHGFIGATITYIPVSAPVSGAATARIRRAADRTDPLGHSDLALLSLLLATGLGAPLLDPAPPHARRHLDALLARDLPATLRHLTTQTEAALGDAVLAGRK